MFYGPGVKCGCADVAAGKMRINIRILPALAPSVTGILQPITFMDSFAIQLR